MSNGVEGEQDLGEQAGTGWCWALSWAALILVFSCLPYLIAWFTTPAGYQFGGVLVNPLDGHSYLAKMRQGWAGEWQFHLSYTPEEHDGAWLYTFYLALGHLARLTGLSLAVVYHAARLLAGLVLLTAIYAFVGRLTGDQRGRRLAYALAGASAGLGWLGLAWGAFPIDLWVPEAFAFFSLLTNPHFPLALALMLFILARVVWRVRAAHGWLLPGLAALALTVVQPIALAPLYAALSSYLLLEYLLGPHAKRGVWGCVTYVLRSAPFVSVVLFSVPVLLYDFIAFASNPILAAWAAQDVDPAPAPADLALGFGAVGLASIAGAALAIRQRDVKTLALVAWAATTLILVYLPVALQRRFITSLGLPLAMLAGLGLARWARLAVEGVALRLGVKLAVGLSVALSLAGSGFLLAVLSLGALSQQQADRLPNLLYLSYDEAAAMRWLLEHAPDSVVLAAPRTGAWLPGQAGVRVVVGHPLETIDAPSKQAQVEAFWRGRLSSQDWQRLKEEYRVQYVFYGPAERQLGPGLLLSQLQVVFQQGEVAIYRTF